LTTAPSGKRWCANGAAPSQHHDGLALCVLTRRGLAADRSTENIARLAKRAVERRLDQLPLVAELVAQHREMQWLIEALRDAPARDAAGAVVRSADGAHPARGERTV